MAVFGAAWLASNSFEGWRKQRLAEKRMNQAERLLSAAHKARWALNTVRSKFIAVSELEAAKEHLERYSRAAEVTDARVQAQVFMDRLRKSAAEVQELQHSQPLARALFSQDVENALSALQWCFIDVESAAHRSATNLSDVEKEEVWQTLRNSGSDDRITRDVDAQIAIIEAACIPVLHLDA